ncbi:MAG: ABC transporter substrate-binding protein [Acidimicrobiia bacterium]
MRRMKRAAPAVVAMLVAAGAAAPAAGAASRPSLPKCPIGAIAKLPAAKKPVQITMWNAQRNVAPLRQLADQFNGSQSDVKVNVVDLPNYDVALQKFLSGLSTGDLPDVAMMQEIDLQKAIDTAAMLPAQSCANAEKYSFRDHVKRIVDYFTVGGVLWPMPFNTSTPLFYYDKHDFETAGLDPTKPPVTLDDLEADAKKLKAAGIATPFVFKVDGWYLEHWFAKAGVLYANNRNGRRSRATSVLFDNRVGRSIFRFLQRMQRQGLAKGVDHNSWDNLFAIGNGNASMTIDTSAALGTIQQVLGSGGGSDKQLQFGVGRMPSPRGPGSVVVGGGSIYLVRKGRSAAQQEGAWRWAKFLNEAKSQAAWSAATGYLPVRRSAVQMPEVQAAWAKSPGYRIAYEQLLAGANTDATAGPVVGPYTEVRDAVNGQMAEILDKGKAPTTALTDAAAKANSIIAEYNDRLGQ